MYTLIEKDVILGFLTACEIPGILSRNIKIDTVAIAPEYQNKGYGIVPQIYFWRICFRLSAFLNRTVFSFAIYG